MRRTNPVILPAKEGQNSIDFFGLEDPNFTYLGDKSIGKWLHTFGRRIADDHVEAVGDHRDVYKPGSHFETVSHYRKSW
jgi:hypothetical protein